MRDPTSHALARELSARHLERPRGFKHKNYGIISTDKQTTRQADAVREAPESKNTFMYTLYCVRQLK